ncbi:hypothetical protein OS493_021584 [Desmophyllum pertusum]|uniref:Uncharacterized protein n=1 Tax=Desmophyllum pertusum TaxID=174260 RepID=A0A9X0CK06_9CNID|nr:hypothetical protein OS493_021584 [Desmophyllum pertusum]
MPLTLRQLQHRFENCIENIEEKRKQIEDLSIDEISYFNPRKYMTRLTKMRQEELNAFERWTDKIPRIIELCRQATSEEHKRRGFAHNIEVKKKQEMSHFKHKFKRVSKKQKRLARNMKKIAQEEDLTSSQSSEEDNRMEYI